MSVLARSIGLGDSQAATITAFLNVCTALGRPFIGVASDHVGDVQIYIFPVFSISLCYLAASYFMQLIQLFTQLIQLVLLFQFSGLYKRWLALLDLEDQSSFTLYVLITCCNSLETITSKTYAFEAFRRNSLMIARASDACLSDMIKHPQSMPHIVCIRYMFSM
jgi:hypothetical protein